MAQMSEQADNHNTEKHFIPSNQWGKNVDIDSGLIRENISSILTKIAPCKPRIIGVTKYYGIKAVVNGFEAGLRDFGESRVLDAAEKIDALPDEVRENSIFHFIGHLQTNKAEKAVKYFDYIHSIDSVKIAEAVSKAAKKIGKTVKILLQVNNANEEQKFGYSKEQLECDLLKIINLENVEVLGLMNMAPLGASENVLETLFKDLKRFRDSLEEIYQIKLPELSMGMSDDYEYAVKAGATMIRIGRKLFT